MCCYNPPHRDPANLGKITHVNSLKSTPPKLLNGGLKLKLLLVVVACLGFSYFSHEGLSRSEIGAVIEAVPIS